MNPTGKFHGQNCLVKTWTGLLKVVKVVNCKNYILGPSLVNGFGQWYFILVIELHHCYSIRTVRGEGQ